MYSTLRYNTLLNYSYNTLLNYSYITWSLTDCPDLLIVPKFYTCSGDSGRSLRQWAQCSIKVSVWRYLCLHRYIITQQGAGADLGMNGHLTRTCWYCSWWRGRRDRWSRTALPLWGSRCRRRTGSGSQCSRTSSHWLRWWRRRTMRESDAFLRVIFWINRGVGD